MLSYLRPTAQDQDTKFKTETRPWQSFPTKTNQRRRQISRRSNEQALYRDGVTQELMHIKILAYYQIQIRPMVDLSRRSLCTLYIGTWIGDCLILTGKVVKHHCRAYVM